MLSKDALLIADRACIASQRFIVIKKKVANEFIEKFMQKTEKLKVGDPLSVDTDIGPVH